MLSKLSRSQLTSHQWSWWGSDSVTRVQPLVIITSVQVLLKGVLKETGSEDAFLESSFSRGLDIILSLKMSGCQDFFFIKLAPNQP